jgi:hypothetical protein
MNFMAHRILIALVFIAYSHAATFEVKSFGTDRVAFQAAGHSHFHNSLIWGENLEDIAITGGGLISGKALVPVNAARVAIKSSH